MKKAILLAMLATLSFTACEETKTVKNTPLPKPPAPVPEEITDAEQATEQFNEAQRALEEEFQVKIDLPHFEQNAADIMLTTDTSIATANAALDAFAKMDLNSLTFQNTLVKLDTIFYHVVENYYRIGLLAETTTNMDLKAAAKEAELRFSKWFTDVNARRDIYNVVQAYANTNPVLEGEDLRLLNKTLQSYKRTGFHLPDDVFAEVTALRKQLADLTNQISTNIGKSNRETISFHPDEAEGIPADLLASVKTDEEGNYVISPGIFGQYAVFNIYSPIEATRKKAFIARQQRAKESNHDLMNQVVRIRAKLSELLGYSHWADYKTEDRMAGSGARALSFISELSEAVDPKFLSERRALTKLKVEDTGDENAVLQAWDFRYFLNEYKKREFDVDTNELKKYFEYNNTLLGMFKVFEDIFAIKIQEVEAPYKWDEKVRLILLSDGNSGAPLGYLYLDMFPRPETEKYGHFAHFTIRPGKLLEDGTYRRPVTSLVCNFPEAIGDKPALLSLDNVETLFHEFGHALHALLTKAKYYQFAGTSVARDFVEAPSQMLEYFVLDKEILDRFAFNYEDPSDTIPQEMLDRIKDSQVSTVATTYRRQFAFGMMDLRMHSEIKADDTTIDIVEFTNKILGDIFLPFPEETAQVASFGHLWGGYDAGYYGYAWSDNVAADLASVFEESPSGFNNKEIGMRLRTEIYEVGGARDENKSIEAFLGRELSSEAFLRKLGL